MHTFKNYESSIQKLLLAVVLHLAFSTSQIFAREESKELIELVRQIVAKNDSLTISELDAARTIDNYKQVKYGFLPDLNVTQNNNKKWQEENTQPSPYATSNPDSIKSSASVNLSQNLFRGYNDKRKLDSADLSTKLKLAQLHERQSNLARTVITSIGSIAIQKAELTGYENERALMQKRLEAINRDVKAGNSRRADHFNMMASIAAEDVEIAARKRNLESDLSQFESTYSVSLKSFDLSLATFEQVLMNLKNADTVATSPSVYTKMAALDLSQNEVKVQQSSNGPSVDFGVSYKFYDNDETTKNNKLSASLNLTAPVPFGFQHNARVDESIKAKQSSEIDLKIAREEHERSVELKRKTVEREREALTLLQNLAKVSKDNLKNQESDRASGFARLSDVLAAQESYFETVRKLESKKYQVISAEIDYLFETGKDIRNQSSSPNAGKESTYDK